jgi:hypothetical protein
MDGAQALGRTAMGRRPTHSVKPQAETRSEGHPHGFVRGVGTMDLWLDVSTSDGDDGVEASGDFWRNYSQSCSPGD